MAITTSTLLKELYTKKFTKGKYKDRKKKKKKKK